MMNDTSFSSIFAIELVPNAVSSAQGDLQRDFPLSVRRKKKRKF